MERIARRSNTPGKKFYADRMGPGIGEQAVAICDIIALLTNLALEGQG
jgi:hypothetical protein